MPFVVPGWMGIVFIVMAVSIAIRISGRGGSRLKNRWGGFSEDLERRIAELEESQRQVGAGDTAALAQRVAELEERLDFAERMLARQKEADRLSPPRA